ncbi:hypothetical protein B566_EDAN017155 [Ephemera danica]|nr:hypothetical protein B566_EDAN017155 [Ephemera danica]
MITLLVAEGKKKKRKPTQLITKETTVAGFMRIVAMRLLFGLAQWAGLGEWASGLFGGALVPPGSDYDYGDYGGDYKDEYDGDGDDDYDY